MKPILFIAEMGSGFGHVRRMLPLARAAAAEGYHPIFAVPNPSEVSGVVGPEIEVRRAPAPRVRSAPPRSPAGVARSFVDILGRAGFADRHFLVEAVRAWQAFVADIRPLAAVCEFSPFFCLATAGGALPVLVSGYGFVLPPPDAPRFPPLREGPPAYPEETLLDAIRAATGASGLPRPATLPALFAGTSHAVTGLEELDAYRAIRAVRAVGPPETEARFSDDEPTEDLFAYLNGEGSGTGAMLEAMALSGMRGRVFVRRATEAHRAAVAGTRIAWLDRPEPIGAALARSRLVVHHGSMLTSEEALIAGRPQLVVPLYLEHLLTARDLLGLGTARVVTAGTPVEAMRSGLETALADERCALAARAFARARQAMPASGPELSLQLLRSVV